MNCNNYNTIKVTAGNAFSLLLPLKEKHYISEQPIEKTINAALLTDVQVLLNNEEWSEFELGEDGVLVRFPSTLSKGVYNIELTAKYGGIAIRAAYFQCLSIVAWSYQSDAENYIPTSPLVADAAFVISVNGDEELTALKEQYRNAIAATEAEKAEYERKVAELDGVAQESTSQEILDKVRGIKGENQEATNSKILEKLENVTNEIVSDILSRVNVEVSYDGFTTNDGSVIKGGVDLLNNKGKIIKIVDSTSATWDFKCNQLFGEQLKYVKLKNALTLGNYPTSMANIEQFYADSVINVNWINFFYRSEGKQRVISLLNTTSVEFGTGNYMYCPANLIDFRFGKGLTSNANVSGWSPVNALLPDSTILVDAGEPFESNLEKLLYNIREHIAANLNPNITATITFSAAVKAAILASEETMEAFPKSWTIA